MLRRPLALVLVLASLAVTLGAQGGAVRISEADTMHAVLSRHVGGAATLKLDSGDELTGKVLAVGEHVVHLAELSGKEFYDAVIDIDEIAAVILRAREQ
jgi:hypothetical protein